MRLKFRRWSSISFSFIHILKIQPFQRSLHFFALWLATTNYHFARNLIKSTESAFFNLSRVLKPKSFDLLASCLFRLFLCNFSIIHVLWLIPRCGRTRLWKATSYYWAKKVFSIWKLQRKSEREKERKGLFPSCGHSYSKFQKCIMHFGTKRNFSLKLDFVQTPTCTQIHLHSEFHVCTLVFSIHHQNMTLQMRHTKSPFESEICRWKIVRLFASPLLLHSLHSIASNVAFVANKLGVVGFWPQGAVLMIRSNGIFENRFVFRSKRFFV